MSFEKESETGEYEFCCDECGEILDTGETTFFPAKERILEEDWSIKKFGSEWRHYCPECK